MDYSTKQNRLSFIVPSITENCSISVSNVIIYSYNLYENHPFVEQCDNKDILKWISYNVSLPKTLFIFDKIKAFLSSHRRQLSKLPPYLIRMFKISFWQKRNVFPVSRVKFTVCGGKYSKLYLEKTLKFSNER